MRVCANCGKDLFGARETGSSSIYAPTDPRDYELCMPCWDAEEELIEIEGTNDLPRRLARYRDTLKAHGDA